MDCIGYNVSREKSFSLPRLDEYDGTTFFPMELAGRLPAEARKTATRSRSNRTKTDESVHKIESTFIGHNSFIEFAREVGLGSFCSRTPTLKLYISQGGAHLTTLASARSDDVLRYDVNAKRPTLSINLTLSKGDG